MKHKNKFKDKSKNKLICTAAAALCLIGLSGCGGGQSLQMANELRFTIANLSDLTISYDEEKLTFFTGDGDELVVREYMTANKSSYHARVDQRKDSIKISEGGKPFFKSGFLRCVEVYLPADYEGNLTITSTDGDIDLSDVELNLSALRIDSASGNVDLKMAEAEIIHLSSTRGTLKTGNLKAGQIRLETTSGNTVCERLEGDVTYTSTSGNAEIKSAVGSGSYKADNSGKLDVVYLEVTGDLYLFNKNDDVHITLPANLEFEFQAATKNGSISTSFPEAVTVDGRTIKGTVGSQPTVTIEVETKNGNIEVIR